MLGASKLAIKAYSSGKRGDEPRTTGDRYCIRTRAKRFCLRVHTGLALVGKIRMFIAMHYTTQFNEHFLIFS
jgi:hypothetical protein